MRVKDVIKHKIVIFVKDGQVNVMHSSKVSINLPGERRYYCHHSSHRITDAPRFSNIDEYIKHLMSGHGDDEAMKIIDSLSGFEV